MSKTYNSEFINVLQTYAEVINNPMKEKAYTKAAQTIIAYDKPIHSHEDVKELKGIGKSIYAKLKEYVDEGPSRVPCPSINVVPPYLVTNWWQLNY